jgi:hypothetical protein
MSRKTIFLFISQCPQLGAATEAGQLNQLRSTISSARWSPFEMFGSLRRIRTFEQFVF